MSAFDLAGDHDSATLIDQARANPLDLSQPVGFFTGMGTGLATGVGRLLADMCSARRASPWARWLAASTC
jgi:hypothetical protein